MVAFQTLLLGIVTGLVQIQLMVAPPVVSVELRLDGKSLGVIASPPWVIECDLGRDPLPHELTALGSDAHGHVVARNWQLVNLGRQRAAVAAIVDRDPESGRPTALRIEWNSLELAPHPAVRVTLDARRLTVEDPHLVPLPEIDTSTPHVAGVEVDFSPTLQGRSEIAFAGDVAGGSAAEMTPVAVTLPPGTPRLEPSNAQALFSEGASSLEVAAVEDGPADVEFVIDQVVEGEAVANGRKWARAAAPDRRRRLSGPLANFDTFFVADARARGDVTPQPGSAALFPRSQQVPLVLIRDSILPLIRVWLSSFSPRPPDRTRIADAVAFAGLEAAGSNHRRAVVLVLAERAHPEPPGLASRDSSVLSATGVRSYLAARAVPLQVWSLTGEDPGPLTRSWGPAEDVSTVEKFVAAEQRLEARLASQRIVWLRGRHLPQRIALDESKTALRLAR